MMLPTELQLTRDGRPCVSHALAGLLTGQHDLTKLQDHGGRVEFLYGLQALHDAVDKTGWAEHTNDWDWSVTVVMRDGTEHGATFEEPYRNCDTFWLAVKFDDSGQLPYTPDKPGHVGITHLCIEVDHMDEAVGSVEIERLVIDDIARIDIEEA